MMWKWTLLAVVLGFAIDLFVGDPRWLYHPVRLIGNGISLGEKILRPLFPKNKTGERIAGTLLVVLVVGFSTAIPLAVLWAAYHIHTALGVAIETFWCYQLLATRSLRDESMKVEDALARGTIEDARYAVSMIVGRDTDSLDEEGVTKAAVETVAENASDGVIAPLFYMAIGGAVLGFTYKAINTLDSMIGYKNDRYQYFGTAGARLDDIANFIPARLCAWLMITASGVCGLDQKFAKKIYLRDRHNHASPNSAHTEAVMAGALNVQLAGPAWYFGKLHDKPTIGDNIRPVEPEDIARANRLLYTTAAVALLLFVFVRAAVQLFIVL